MWGETYGLSPSFLEGLGIAPPLVCRVFVANVSNMATKQSCNKFVMINQKFVF